MSVQKKQIAQHLFEKALVEQRQTRPRVRNENHMQLTHPLEISLPGAVFEPSEQGDAQLVKASQHRNQDAFAFLVQRHQRRVFTMVLRMLQDYVEASEITQEAFFREDGPRSLAHLQILPRVANNSPGDTGMDDEPRRKAAGNHLWWLGDLSWDGDSLLHLYAQKATGARTGAYHPR